MKKTIKRIIKKIIVIILILMQTIISTSSFAESYDPEYHGASIAGFAEDFVTENHSELKYPSFSDPQLMAKLSKGVMGEVWSDGYWYLQCNTYASYIYGRIIGYTKFLRECNADTIFNKVKKGEADFEEISPSEAMPGDLLLRPNLGSGHGHVMVYLGDNKIAHASSPSKNMIVSQQIPGENSTIVARLKPEIDIELLEDFSSGVAGKKDYKYYGLPSEAEYTGTETLWEKLKSSLKWIINKLSQIVDYMIGLITMFIRMQMVGWAAIVEEVVTKSINAVTGEVVVQEENPDNNNSTNNNGQQNNNQNNVENNTENENAIDNQTEEDDEETEALIRPASNNKKIIDDDRITVERIIYNQIPILDIDIFNPTEAAGKKLTEDGALTVVRKTIATWYNVVRNISIVAMLLVLIYLGIKLAISSVAKDKAQYKSMLVNWLVGFVILVSIHYIMITIIWLNQQLVEIFVNLTPDNELSIYETVRTKAYELKFSSGFIGAIMYMYLVYMMIRYLYVYIRRLFTIIILIVMAPVMGATYAFNKIKNGTNTSFKNWFTDFTAFTFIQSVHALIYTTFLNIILELSTESLPGVLLAFIVMNFMLKADRIIVDMFGLAHSKELSSTMTPGGYVKAFAAVKGSQSLLKRGLSFGKNAAKTTGGVVGFIGGAVVPNQIKSKFKMLNYSFNKKYNNMLDTVWGENNIKKHRPTSNNMSEAEIRLEEVRAEKRELKKYNRKTSIDFGKSMITGGFQALAAIPVTIADPKSGMTLAFNAYDNLNKYRDIKKYKSYKDKNVRYYAKKIVLVPMTLSGVAYIPTRYMVKRADVKQKETLIKQELNPKMQVLYTAKIYENELENAYKEIMNETNELCDNQENKMFGMALKKKYNESLQEGIENALKEVTDEQVKLAIMDYTTLKTRDVDSIIEELELSVQDKYTLRNDTREIIDAQSNQLDKDSLRKLLEEKEINNVSEKEIEEIIQKINNENNVKELKKESIAKEIKKELGRANKNVEANVVDKIVNEVVEKGVKENDEINELATTTLKRLMAEQNIELSEKDTNEVITIIEKVSVAKKVGKNNIEEEVQNILNQTIGNSNISTNTVNEVVSSMKEESIKNRNEVMSKENLKNVINSMANDNNITIDSKKVEKLITEKQKEKNNLTTSDVNNIIDNVQKIINDEKLNIQLTNKAKENTTNEIKNEISKTVEKGLKEPKISNLIPDSSREEIINEIKNMSIEVTNEKDIRKVVKDKLKKLDNEKIDIITKNIKKEIDASRRENMNATKIEEAIRKGINKRDSIDRGRNVQMHEKFIDNIYKLKDINDIHEEKYGEPIYKDIRVTLKRIEDLYKY